MTSADVQNDGRFRAALDERINALLTLCEEIVELGPPIDAPGPGEGPGLPTYPDSDRANDQSKLAESIARVNEIGDLVSQFADPSAEGARDRIDNLDNVDGVLGDGKLVPTEASSGLHGFVLIQLTGWNGDARYEFDWRFADLMIALACQQEVALALREAMKLHWSLLCAARGTVLAILDNAIRTLRTQNQEADNEIETFLTDAWVATKQYVNSINVIDLTLKVIKESAGGGGRTPMTGPAKVLAEEVWNLASVLLDVAVDAITEPDSDDPRPALNSAIERLRDVRAGTQADSGKIAASIDRLTEYLYPGERMYDNMIHEAGPTLPAMEPG